MTRYKELRRMENGIVRKNVDELKWAEEWATTRLALATPKIHIKAWKKRLQMIREALEDAGD